MHTFTKSLIRFYTLFLSIFTTGQHINCGAKKEEWITLFVHGNISVKPYLNCKNVILLMRDALEDCEYKISADFLRRDAFFYEIQPMHDLGLVPIKKEYQKKIGDACAASAQLFDFLLEEAGYNQNNNYYLYGWSGLMSHKARVAEAKIFYDELAQLADGYTKEGRQPKIRLIGYSHGGNLCLNLAEYHKTAEKKIPNIDQLILLGMPVQVENDFLAGSDLFKQIYHFYSSADKIQRIDPFSFKRFLSRKRFHQNKPDNLVQIQIAFLEEKLVRKRNRIQKRVLDYSPGHAELWFFGWTPLNYRADFPLYPLALVHLLPILLPSIEAHAEKKEIELAVNLTTQKIIVKKKSATKEVVSSVLLNLDAVKTACELALAYKPLEHTIEAENKHIEEAIRQGRDAHKKKRALKKMGMLYA
jgi:hypothetical protein